jgi:mevalonate kinase
MIKTSAPGNVFFLGEHSVVYERQAIVAAVNKRTYSTISSRNDNKIILKSEGYGEAEISLEKNNLQGDDLHYLAAFVNFYMENDSYRGFELSITSEIPKDSGGMSSSTAFLCSALAALDNFYKIERPLENYFDVLYPFQVKIHGGKASGAELVSSSMGGYNKVRLDKSGEEPVLERKYIRQRDHHLIVGDTGIEAKTSKAVKYVENNWKERPEDYENIFDEIECLVEEGEKAIFDHNIVRLGELMNQNHKILAKDLGISHPRLNKLVDASREAGAYGAKLSGGGLGGIMIALVDEDTLDSVTEAIEKHNGTPYLTKVGVEGVRIENDF